MKYKTEIETYVQEHIDKCLKEKGITAYKLGTQGTVTPKTVYNIIEGKTRPSLELLELVTIAAGITMSEFFKEYDEKHVPKQSSKQQFSVKVQKQTGLEGMVRVAQQFSHSSMKAPVYIMHSADNKELYLVAKLENNGPLDDGYENKIPLILKDKPDIHS